MLANVLLIRWVGGWAERFNTASIVANGRREAVISLGAVQSAEEAYRISDEQLRIYANTRSQITADIEPVGNADTPYLSFAVGDRVTVPNEAGTPSSQRVVAITVSEDDDGRITYAPELNDLIIEAQERLADRIRKLSTGTAGMG
jgi:hypothetical protein